VRTKETIKKMKKSASGEKHWNWQGGKTSESLRLRSTTEYRSWRKSVFERDNFTCVQCGQRGCFLNADHIKPWAYYPDLRFDVDNGRTLCLTCHYKTDTFGWKNIKRTNLAMR
jgi:5-methylcytosine-specific restriction endonuclease McrA